MAARRVSTPGEADTSYFFFEDLFLAGTLAPDLRASERPIAMACLRLFTFLPDLPLRNVPFFFSFMTFLTLSCDFLPYLAIVLLLGIFWVAAAAMPGGKPLERRRVKMFLSDGGQRTT